jgi:hypothetical protein
MTIPKYPSTKAVQEELAENPAIVTIAVDEGDDATEHISGAIYAIFIQSREEATGKIWGSAYVALSSDNKVRFYSHHSDYTHSNKIRSFKKYQIEPVCECLERPVFQRIFITESHC